MTNKHIRLLVRALKGKSKFRLLSAIGIVIIGLTFGQGQELDLSGSAVNQSDKKALLPQSSWPAKVVSITDGDTVKVIHTATGEQLRVRLYGIDAPEKKQEFGDKSHQFLTELIGNDDLIVESVNKDRYGRLVAILYTASNGHCLNEAMIQAGMAWVYPQYCKIAVCRSWIASEGMAERNRVGLWAEDQPVAPWQWRKR